MPSTPKEHFEYTIREWTGGEFSQMLKNLPSDLKVIYDIGANAGGFTQIMHSNYPEAHLYCFEPVQINFDSLRENTPYAAHFKKGIFYGAKRSRVLWRGENIGAFFVEQINAGEPRIHRDSEFMDLEELESFTEVIEKPDLIKMDVEGAEVNIIEHSKAVKECPWLIIEWHPDEDAITFFAKHLPNHRVVHRIANNQFLLKL